MTLGQRIQELRKQHGMSQESLGEALGVSRQAVSKWEGDNGIPELDTLITMSRLFDVTVGQLLGIEEPSGQESGTSGDSAEDNIESVLRRYTEQTAKKDERSRLSRWGWTVSAAVVVTTAFIVLFAQLNSLRGTVKLLRSNLSNLQTDVFYSQSSLSEEIRNTIYDIMAEEAELLSTFHWEIVDYDLEKQTATLRLDATMKEYTAGSRLQFCTKWYKVDDTEGQTNGDWVNGPDFSSEITIPLNHLTEISIRVEDADGNIREQLLQEYIHTLHPDNFHLDAYNLTLPFAVTVKGFGISTSTVKAEPAYVDIVSVFPEFFRPIEAVITAYLNGIEIMNETMTITESGREAGIFRASIKNDYYDLTMKDGDSLEVELTVTDSLGRTEQFSDRISVENGRLESVPIEITAPVVSAQSR